MIVMLILFYFIKYDFFLYKQKYNFNGKFYGFVGGIMPPFSFGYWMEEF